MKKRRPYIFILSLLLLAGYSAVSQNVESKLKEETTKYERANAEFMMIEAQKFFLLEDYERALAFLDKSLEVDDENHAAYFKKAEIYLIESEYKKGLDAIRKAIGIIPNNKYYYVLGAELEKADRNLEGAAKFYELMVENATQYKAYLIELASTYQGVDLVKEAIEVFESFDDLDLDQNMKLVELYMQNSKEKNAIDLMEQLKSEYPSDNDLKYQYANLLNLVGDTDLAIKTLEAEPNKTAEMRLLLSELYEGTGSTNSQNRLLIESFSDPNASLTDKTLLLGQMLLETSPDDLPINLIDSLQTSLEYRYPNELVAIENGSYVYSKLAEITEGNQKDLFNQKAINRYQKLKELKPGDFKVWDKVLTYEYNSNDWEALSADAEEALSLYPNQAIFYIYLASAKINQNEVNEAEDLLNQASRMSRNNELLTSQILGKQAEIAQLKSDSSTANQLYQKAIRLPVIHPETTISYGEFRSNYSISEAFTKGETVPTETKTKRSKQRELAYNTAFTLYKDGDLNGALIAMIPKIQEFENKRDGEAVELYGDIFAQLNLVDLAVKYWKLAKTFGGTSDKIDQKIANGKTK